MVQKSRFVVISIVILATAFGLSYAASAASIQGPLPAGTTRYAVVSSTVNAQTNSLSFATVPGLSTTIAIPPGKKGDVMVSFCGETRTVGQMIVRAVIGGVVASPPKMIIRAQSGTNGDFGSRCAEFYRLGVPSGSVSVKMQWEGFWLYPGWIYLYNRTMIVTENIH